MTIGQRLNVDVVVNVANPININQILKFVPSTNLTEFLRGTLGLDLSDTNPVPSWTGVQGSSATQGTESLRPLFVEDAFGAGLHGVQGDGVDDYLQFVAPGLNAGIICVAFKTPASFSGTVDYLIGSKTAGSNLNVGLAINASNQFSAQIGSLGVNDLNSSPLSASTEYEGALLYFGGTATLFLDAVSVDTGAFTGSAGTSLMNLCAYNDRGTPISHTDAILGGVAVYSDSSGVTLSEVESGVAETVGVTLT